MAAITKNHKNDYHGSQKTQTKKSILKLKNLNSNFKTLTLTQNFKLKIKSLNSKNSKVNSSSDLSVLKGEAMVAISGISVIDCHPKWLRTLLRYQHHSYLLTVLLFQHLFQTQYLMFYSTYQRVTPLLTTA